MEEEDYIHSTLLPALTHCCCSCCNGSKAAAIAALSLSLYSFTHTHVLSLSQPSHFALTNMPLL
jgi:hypothetical protein